MTPQYHCSQGRLSKRGIHQHLFVRNGEFNDNTYHRQCLYLHEHFLSALLSDS